MSRVIASLCAAACLFAGATSSWAAAGPRSQPDYRYDFVAEMVRATTFERVGTAKKTARTKELAATRFDRAQGQAKPARAFSFSPVVVAGGMMEGALITLDYRYDFLDTTVEMGRAVP
jgi:hypothetical protein